jgi:protein SCO1
MKGRSKMNWKKWLARSVLSSPVALVAGCGTTPADPVPTAAEPVVVAAAPTTAACCDACPHCQNDDADLYPERDGPATLEDLTVSPWLDMAGRTRKLPDLSLSDQDGRHYRLADLADRPLAVTFLYTRCRNPNKCPLIASTMAELQEQLEVEGLADQVRLLVVTYDPGHDTPTVLKEYGAQHGFRFGGDLLALRPELEQRKRLFDALGIRVNFDTRGQVNIHGIQLMLVDRHGRLARSYHTLIWDNARVIDDLQRLVTES